ncbi:MAG: serine/threonine protein kinase [Sandaracinaceae bacterium]|nr:serine/threonine protein kinase [Sandaracinaceae bacterium]
MPRADDDGNVGAILAGIVFDAEGTVLAGRYQLVERSGQGGMAAVWRAVTRGAAGFIRPVAVKRILGGLSHQPEFVQMFVEEARVGATLDHPNVVQIHDFGRDTLDNYYLVMEWVEGVDLGRWSASYKEAGWHAPWHLTAAIGIESLRGLHAAHTRTDPWGNVAPTFHRDVTPGNVLIGLNGIVKIADFGLARAMDRAKITRPEMVKGKTAYVAPELIDDGLEASAQSDIFALGIVLWEVLASRSLFAGKTDIDSLRNIIACDVPPLEEIRPDLPPALVQTIERALQRDPRNRFGTAREMLLALAKVLRRVAEPTDAEPLGQSVALARQRLNMPPRDLPPDDLVPLRGTRPQWITPDDGTDRDSVEIPLIPGKRS